MRLLYYIFPLFYTRLAFLYGPILKLALRGRWIYWQLSLKEHVSDRKRILEIGCGTGSLLAELGRYNLKIIGIDQSYQMIRVAKKKIRNTCGLSRIAVAQAQALPFKNNSFDTVISIFPSAYIQYHGTWREAKRVLTTDGIFVCLIWVKMEPGTLRAVVQRMIYGTNEPEFESLIHLAGIEGFGTRIEKIPDREGNVMFVLLCRKAPLNRED